MWHSESPGLGFAFRLPCCLDASGEAGTAGTVREHGAQTQQPFMLLLLQQILLGPILSKDGGRHIGSSRLRNGQTTLEAGVHQSRKRKLPRSAFSKNTGKVSRLGHGDFPSILEL